MLDLEKLKREVEFQINFGVTLIDRHSIIVDANRYLQTINRAIILEKALELAIKRINNWKCSECDECEADTNCKENISNIFISNAENEINQTKNINK